MAYRYFKDTFTEISLRMYYVSGTLEDGSGASLAPACSHGMCVLSGIGLEGILTVSQVEGVRSPRKKLFRFYEKGGTAPKMSLRDSAYKEIQKRIITLYYRPGAYVNEAQVCSDLGMGRTPVHMALERLAIDGMIDIMPRKGAIIRSISLDEIMAVIEARLIAEPAAARLAASRASEDQLLRMAQIVADADQRTARGDTEGLMQLDREFHSTIAEATRNPVLAQQLRSLHERSLRMWFISLSDPPRHLTVGREHRDILQALRTRDETVAERVMREHIESFMRMIRGQLSDDEWDVKGRA